MMPTEDEAKHVLDDHADNLAALPNVVGVGLTTTADQQGSAVAVYVRAKLPLSQLAPSDVVPQTLSSAIAGTTVEVPTQVIEVGEISH